MPEGQQEQRILAMFVDFENLAIGFEEKQKEKKRREEQAAFDVQKVLGRLVEKGNVVVKNCLRRLAPLF